MRIDGIAVYRVNMPLVYPFRTAFGNDTAIESLLVRMDCGGVAGWGEASPWRAPAYSPEWAAGAFRMVGDFLAPLLVGREMPSGNALQSALASVKGNFFAKAVLDQAWWDLAARTRGEPLFRMLGGQRDTVDVGADFGVMESIPDLLETIETALTAGFKRVKLKYRPGWDLPMVRTVRATFPEATFHIDCNSAYTLDDLDMFRALDDLGLAMIEQPLAHDDLVDHATLQRALRTPVCLDESITSVAKARKAIALGACRYVNIKPGRVGGLTNAVAIHDLCLAAGVPCWVGGMLESAVGAYQCLALATLPNFTYPADIFPSTRFYRPDLSTPEVTLSAPSRITVPPGAGCGAVPRPEALAAATVEKASFRGA